MLEVPSNRGHFNHKGSGISSSSFFKDCIPSIICSLSPTLYCYCRAITGWGGKLGQQIKMKVTLKPLFTCNSATKRHKWGLLPNVPLFLQRMAWTKVRWMPGESGRMEGRGVHLTAEEPGTKGFPPLKYCTSEPCGGKGKGIGIKTYRTTSAEKCHGSQTRRPLEGSTWARNKNVLRLV